MWLEILRICVARVSGHYSETIGHSNTEGGEMKKNQTVEVDSEDDLDECDIAEVNCELAMVQGQLCSIPYEVYDLPDLTGILSIETWNSFLTEGERFFLSCFLPDMDQETFSLTMQELLGGANLCFGNPVDMFYKKLRGGLFTPKVSCCKEGVIFVKRKMYYYSLRYYHEKLIKTFTEMQRLWDQYGKELGNNTKLLLWSERRKRGNLKLLDLNKVPSENLDSATCRLTPPNGVKSVGRNRTKSSTFPLGGGSNNTFKLKITKKGIFRYQSPSFVSSQHHHQILPKGLLKVIPKPSSIILGEPYVAPENNLLQIHESYSKSTRFTASPYSGTRFGKPYGTIACPITEFPKCLLNYQDTSLTYLETTQRSSIKGTEPVLHDPTHTIPGASNYSITEHNLISEKEEYVHYHLKYPGFKPRILEKGSETMETKRVLSDKNFQRKPLSVLGEDNHVRETDDDHLFSLTYKRRKVQRKGVA